MSQALPRAGKFSRPKVTAHKPGSTLLTVYPACVNWVGDCPLSFFRQLKPTMPKRPATIPKGDSAKRKHSTLSIAKRKKKKKALIMKLAMGICVSKLSEDCGVGTSTVYNKEPERRNYQTLFNKNKGIKK